MESGKDDLHSKLFEFHAQICDMSRQISANEASYHKQICEGQIEARKKLIDMEKKKMTKAEAFEYLKGTRVYCGDYASEVQRKIFETGVEWSSGGSNLNTAKFLFVGIDGRLTLCFDNNYFKNHDYRELSADDILSIEIVEGTPKFSYEKVVELAKPLMEYLNETGWTEQIGVNYDHIVAQPMAIILHGEMKEERR